MSKFDDAFNDAFNDSYVPEPGGESSRPGDGEEYTIRGVSLTRVTSILSVAPGSFLMPWYAKRAAQACAEIVENCPQMASLLTDFDSSDSVRVLDPEFSETHAPRVFSAREAVNEIHNWQLRMREPERYRDYKGWIGSIVHHAKYDYAISGFTHPVLDINYLQNLAVSFCEFPEPLLARMANLGQSVDDYALELAYSALPYVQSIKDWLDIVQPEYSSHGLEACVANFDEGCAGTEDGRCIIRRSNWEATKVAWPWPDAGDQADVIEDVKTSNSLSQMVGFQLAAYAHSPYLYLFEPDTVFERTVPDGAMALHVDVNHENGPQVTPKAWRRDEVSELFDGFCALNYFYRIMKNKPRAVRSSHVSTRIAKPKRGTRVVPPWEIEKV